ncbi:hypothetical protein T12_1931, partial [Trichinella patagoniensis]
LLKPTLAPPSRMPLLLFPLTSTIHSAKPPRMLALLLVLMSCALSMSLLPLPSPMVLIKSLLAWARRTFLFLIS